MHADFLPEGLSGHFRDLGVHVKLKKINSFISNQNYSDSIS
jgi:hypothetical protein